jgi:hypothetical protein
MTVEARVAILESEVRRTRRQIKTVLLLLLCVVGLGAAAMNDEALRGTYSILGGDGEPKIILHQSGDLDVKGALKVKDTDVRASIKRLEELIVNPPNPAAQIRISSGYHSPAGPFARIETPPIAGEGHFSGHYMRYVSEKIPFDRPFRNKPEVFLIREREDILFNGSGRIYMECVPVEVDKADFRIRILILQPMATNANTAIHWVAIGE